MESAFTLISLIFVGPHIHGQPQLTIPNPSNQASISSQGRGSTVPSVFAESSSSAGINSTHQTFSVLQATMLSLKKTQVLSALRSWTVSAEASSSAGINSTHLTFSVLQASMFSLKKTQVLSALRSWTVSAEASSSADIDPTHLTFLVLQATMVCFLRKLCWYLINVKNNFRDRFKFSRY